MSAIGSLWRRAPAWRLCCVGAVAMTAMAAMFPPSVRHLDWHGLARAGGGSTAQARYRPQAADAPTGSDLFELPPPGPGRQGMIAYGGRQLPLPAGSWQELAIDRYDGVEPQQSTLLDRVQDGHLTGLILVATPSALGASTGLVQLPSLCSSPDRIAGNVVPVLPGQSPMMHECWSILPVDMRQQAAGPAQAIVPAGLKRLGTFNVAVADTMLAINYARSDDTGWRVTTIMLPDRPANRPKLIAWAGRFAAVMHKGFDHTLDPSDLTDAVTRDPR